MKTTLRNTSWLMLLALPLTAHAQGMPMASTGTAWYVSPMVGATFGGDTTTTGAATGVSAGWLGTKWLGAEGEVAYVPHLVEQTGFLTDRSAFTGAGTLLLRHPHALGVVPYLAVGVGTTRLRLAEAGGFSTLDVQKPAVHIGGGVMTKWQDHLGVRGDIRYIRSVGNEDDDLNPFDVKVSRLGVWRVSAGLVAWF